MQTTKTQPKRVRLEISFHIPDDMKRRDAAQKVEAAIRGMMASNPSLDLDPATLKVRRFALA
jgi:hypothetical protein